MNTLQQRRDHGAWNVSARLLLLLLAFLPFHADAATIAAGRFHGLLVRDDGSLAAWGYNAAGQLGDGSYIDRSFPVPTTGLTGVKVAADAVAGGLNHTLVLKTDGTVWAWGNNNDGQVGDGTTFSRTLPVQVYGLTGVASVSGGSGHSLARKADGTVWTWGNNDYGQLGDGTATGRIVPARVAGLTGVIAIAGGALHSLALRSDGTVWAWGDNSVGQLGDGTVTGRSAPVQVSGLTGVIGISTSYYHSVALKSDGTVWTWGYNAYGQLGDGTTTSRALPVRVTGVTNVAQVAGGGFATYVLRKDGTAVAWGNNDFGQLGDGTTTQRTTPVAVQGITGAILIAAGASHLSILRADGTISSVGQNVIGQLGDGSIVQASAPMPLSALGSVARLAPGFRHSLALRTDGTIVGWGENVNGELGDGTRISRGTPTPVPGLSNVAAIAAGTGFSMALRADGTVWTWGQNANGQLGDPTVSGRATPAPIPGLTGVVAIAAGEFHGVALRSDGSMWAWGYNYDGQLGDGTTTDRAVPTRVLSVAAPAAIAAGGFHTMILRTDGTVAAWGQNIYGQLGDGTNISRTSPVTVSGLSGVTAIAGGNWHSLALKAGGTVWGWGVNNVGQLGTGTYQSSNLPIQAVGAAGAVSVAAGGMQSMALTSNGGVLAWGGGGTVGDGTDRDSLYPTALSFIGAVDRIAASFDFTLALTRAGTVMGWGSNYSQKLGIPFPVQSTTIVKTKDPVAGYAGSDLVVEFFNPTIKNGAAVSGIGHYFITAAPAEAISIDNGGSGPGWQRTGRTFRVWNDPAKAPSGAVPVQRFYARGPNSHFFTASAAEYQSLRNLNPTNDANLGWSYEGVAFYTVPPQGGGCAAGYFPIYRSYNNRFAQNDSNHRITPSIIDYERSIYFLGYADEGITFCSPVSTDAVADLHAWYIYPGTEVQSGSQVLAFFVFANNGPGAGDGGRVYVALPPEVTDWSICYNPLDVNCQGAAADLTLLRSGQVITPWPAGSVVTVLAKGTAPQVSTGGNASLKFAALTTNGTGTPDANRANNAPPQARTLVRAPQGCNYVVNPASLSLGAAAQDVQVAVLTSSGCAWSVQNSLPWLAVAPAGGSGTGSVLLTPQANTVAAARSGTLLIGGQAVAVTQSGVPCNFSASPSSLTLAAGAQSVQIALTAVPGCQWNAQSSSSWLAVSPTGGSNSAALTVSLAANTVSAARTGAITVSGLTIPVAQAGTAEVALAPAPPQDPCATFRLQRAGDQMPAEGLSGDSSVAVLADAACAWSAQSAVPWLNVTAGGAGSGNGTIRYSVQPNSDPQLRIGTINAANKSFTVTQQARDTTINPGNDSGGDSSGGGGGGGSSGGSGGGSSGGSSG